MYPTLDLYPKIVLADRETTVTVRPSGHSLADGDVWNVSIYALEGRAGQREPRQFTATAQDGALRLRHFFAAEQEHLLLLTPANGAGSPVEFRLYSLEQDLFVRRPFKGDLHLHSNRSDGKDEPGYVAAASRRIGLDFMAVTDHHTYAASLEAQRAFAGVETDLRIYPGEEVHPPDNPVHMVNFGARWSLNERWATDEAAYRAEVAIVADSLPRLPAGVSRYQFASCLWCFQQIRQGGGLGIFCHPYWLYQRRYDVSEDLTTLLLNEQPFDALELIGGYRLFQLESNRLQVARYHEERARGRQIPIIGASDSHGSAPDQELFGWYYTIVFTSSTDLPDLIRGVEELHSVAVEALPGETPHAHGPFRLSKYASFLLREVFPQHDALCAGEGELMLAHLSGDVRAADGLSACRGQTAALLAHLWDVV
jgi:hypothetical protein